MIPKLIQSIFEAGRHAASADNSQPWHFYWDGEQIRITYDDKRVSGKTFTENNPATLLAIGSVIENMTQAAKSRGVDIQWTLFSEYKKPDGYAVGHFDIDVYHFDGQVDPKEPIAVFGRHTNRFSYKKNPLPENIRTLISAMNANAARLELHENKDSIKKIARLVHRCSEVRFQTREVHEWLGCSLKFTREEVMHGDGLDVATIGLPPGGKLFLKFIKDWQRMSFLNTLGGYKLLAKMDAEPIQNASALISIIAGATGHDVINAGRLMTKVWIELNLHGIAVQPFFVITDQLSRLEEGGVPESLVDNISAVKEECTRVFDLQQNEQLHMLLRIGLPKSEVVRSRRLANELILTDLDNGHSAT